MLFVGRIVSTHGIKGELKIISDFQFKDKVFKVGNKLYIDDKEYKIMSYRRHKNFDMVTLNDYNNINDVLHLLKSKVYFKKEDLSLNDKEVLDRDLLEYIVISTNNEIGKVVEVFLASPSNKIIRVMFDKEYLIPFNSPMLVGVNKNRKEIVVDIEEFK